MIIVQLLLQVLVQPDLLIHSVGKVGAVNWSLVGPSTRLKCFTPFDGSVEHKYTAVVIVP